ncbi:MAG: hypothetical protein E6I20_11055 [Chloroflexi bacterium]|nr:MAG: hypothetical protein E6I20_11055 [Chloroflexota bacterium]
MSRPQKERVLFLCVRNSAREACPLFPGAAWTFHWSFPDPAAVEGPEADRLATFRQVRDGLRGRIQAELAGGRTS